MGFGLGWVDGVDGVMARMGGSGESLGRAGLE